jgi:hypothetical protein
VNVPFLPFPNVLPGQNWNTHQPPRIAAICTLALSLSKVTPKVKPWPVVYLSSPTRTRLQRVCSCARWRKSDLFGLGPLVSAIRLMATRQSRGRSAYGQEAQRVDKFFVPPVMWLPCGSALSPPCMVRRSALSSSSPSRRENGSE